MISNALSDILVALIVLGVIIVIHELGHFLMAKFFQIKVETFSIGFGPRLIGFRRGETDYRISALPLGGYVKMAGETTSDVLTGDPREFSSKPKWQRFLVAFAGPAMNVILAVALLTGLYMYGTRVPEFMNSQYLVGVVEPGSPADRAGIRSGDIVESIDGKEDPNWYEVEARVATNPEQPLPLILNRNGERIELSVRPDRRGPAEAGYIGMFPLIRVVLEGVQPGGPAETAGLKPGDEITSVNGVVLKTAGRSIQDTIQAIPEKTYPITVLRDGQTLEFQVTPITQDGRKMIGISMSPPTVLIDLGFVDAFQKSVDTNLENATLIFQVLGKLVKREASLKTMDGPIGIVRVSGQAAELGLGALISLMAVISLNLGLINALPIPILDGGTMMLLIVEALMGRDLSLRVKERIVQVAFVFLLTVIVFVMYNDVVKLLPSNNVAP